MFPKISLIALLAVVSSYSAIGCDSGCPRSCPGPFLALGIGVYAAVDGVAVSGVEATLMGPTTISMSCEPSTNVPAATSCFWPLGGTFVEGSYTLLVAAPGFQSKELSATLSLTPASRCGCSGATIEPSTVTLDPS
jgi:hypothetical protein